MTRKAQTMSVFSAVEMAPRDPILGLTEAFLADQNPKKVNLGVGVYQDANGKLPVLECVRTVEQQLGQNPKPRGYLPIDGLKAFTTEVAKLVHGADAAEIAENRLVTVQTLSGTGALRVAGDFLRPLGNGTLLLSDPSWENHQAVFTRSGFEVGTYRYKAAERDGLDFDGMLADLRAADKGTVVVLHACCHNPTGYDLSDEQWDQVVQVVTDGELIPLVDMAYQGFAEGPEQDVKAIKKFVATGKPVVNTVSFAKNLSLYGERIGALQVTCTDADEAARVLSQLKVLIRTMVSSSPTHGATVVAAVLSDHALRTQWTEELAGMRERIKEMRRRLVDGLAAAGVTAANGKKDMGFIAEQAGMFSYTGLSKEQMVQLREKWGVYGTDKGRICVAALNDSNIDYVCEAIADVI
ncbi:MULTISPECIES: amino acid aminotransferase [unclassified Luteococcus]|uniref:amino acid aminotransferase n=1 Tax=unclassified Luteococcus TaxID=2639923 RepID=UPI00313AECC9